MTQYTFSGRQPFGPRCQNTHTLAPLYTCALFDPQPLSDVPPTYFWQNSEGYGFDIRNLAVLLKVNFRNLNPHTVTSDDNGAPRKLWCNENDLMSLLYHPMMPSGVRQNVIKRVQILNLLQDETKKRLAHMAGELYSFSLQGFYDWLDALPEEILVNFDIKTSKGALQDNLKAIAADRRRNAIQGILQQVGVQANQHAAEPAGFSFSSDLYVLLEMYKANVVQDFISYSETLKCNAAENAALYDERLALYLQVQFLGLCSRYVLLLREKPRHFAHAQLWYWKFRVPTYAAVAMTTRRRGNLRQSLTGPTLRLSGVRYCHVRFGYDLSHKIYDVAISWDAQDAATLQFHDPGDMWQYLKTELPLMLYQGSVLVTASLSGGIHQLCRSPRWKRSFRFDNNLIYTMGRLLLFVQPPFQVLRDFVDKSPRLLRSDAHLRQFIRDTFGLRLANGFRQLLEEFVKQLPQVYEIDVLQSITLVGGYDNHGTQDLFTKLRGALSRTTCIQDVAAELCEFLSVPYPPEKPEFSRFQVDHTSIPDLISSQ